MGRRLNWEAITQQQSWGSLFKRWERKKCVTDLINVNVMTLKWLKAGKEFFFFAGRGWQRLRLSDEIRLNGRDETAIPFEGAAAIVFHFSKTFTVQTDTEERKKIKKSTLRLRWQQDIIGLQSTARFPFFFSFFFSPWLCPQLISSIFRGLFCLRSEFVKCKCTPAPSWMKLCRWTWTGVTSVVAVTGRAAFPACWWGCRLRAAGHLNPQITCLCFQVAVPTSGWVEFLAEIKKNSSGFAALLPTFREQRGGIGKLFDLATVGPKMWQRQELEPEQMVRVFWWPNSKNVVMQQRP